MWISPEIYHLLTYLLTYLPDVISFFLKNNSADNSHWRISRIIICFQENTVRGSFSSARSS